MLLVLQRVLGREDAAPGVPEQEEVLPVQPQRLADLLHLVDEARQLPQVRLVRLVAAEGAELVVVVVLDPRRRQIAVEGLEVLVGRARPAVQQQQPHRRGVADALGPDPEGALRRLDRDHPHAAAQDVVAAGGVEIARGASGRPVVTAISLAVCVSPAGLTPAARRMSSIPENAVAQYKQAATARYPTPSSAPLPALVAPEQRPPAGAARHLRDGGHRPILAVVPIAGDLAHHEPAGPVITASVRSRGSASTSTMPSAPRSEATPLIPP